MNNGNSDSLAHNFHNNSESFPHSFQANSHILSIDCGGGGIKAALLDKDGELLSGPIRTPVPYPFTPEKLIEIIRTQEATLRQMSGINTKAKRITVGMPGMIRSGEVIYTPHYIRLDGPRTEVSQELAKAWNGLDLETLLQDELGMVARVLNDAEVAACAVVKGYGSELVLTLGTGLGCTFFVDGKLTPHLEISHAPFLNGASFDHCIGEISRQELGTPAWSDRVMEAIIALWPVFRWDHLYLGGGNTALLTPETHAKLTELIVSGQLNPITFIDNSAGTLGGVAAWKY